MIHGSPSHNSRESLAQFTGVSRMIHGSLSLLLLDKFAGGVLVEGNDFLSERILIELDGIGEPRSLDLFFESPQLKIERTHFSQLLKRYRPETLFSQMNLDSLQKSFFEIATFQDY